MLLTSINFVTCSLCSEMLKKLGYESLDQLTDAAVPDNIKLKRDLKLSPAISEVEAIRRIKTIAAKNKVHSLNTLYAFLHLIYHILRVLEPLDTRNNFLEEFKSILYPYKFYVFF